MAQFVYPPVTIDTTGLATEATLQQVETNTANTVTEVQTLTSTVLTDAQLRATAVPVSGPLTDAQLRAVDVPVSATSLPLPTGAATETSLSNAVTELTTLNGVDFATEGTLGSVAAATANMAQKLAASLVPEPFDYQSISYVLAGNGAGEISTVVYKIGGAGGTTVATVTLTYDANNRVSTVTRS